MMSFEDLSPLLHSWPYEPGLVKVRKISGRDGKTKIQMRIDLGILQMETEGRPDGKRPHGFESLYDYHLNRLDEFIQIHGSPIGFSLSNEDCMGLSMESLQYYYRYLSSFYLADYEQVEIDTARNLKIFDFVREYASNENDRFILEHYRPYVIMMQARAKAFRKMKAERTQEALDILIQGINQIKEHYDEIGQPSRVEECEEIELLRKMAEGILETMPFDPVQDLREQMQMAVAQEDYEKAAVLRDEIRRLESNTTLQ